MKTKLHSIQEMNLGQEVTDEKTQADMIAYIIAHYKDAKWSEYINKLTAHMTQNPVQGAFWAATDDNPVVMYHLVSAFGYDYNMNAEDLGTMISKNGGGINGYSLYCAAKTYAEWRKEFAQIQNNIEIKEKGDNEHIIGEINYVGSHIHIPKHKNNESKEEQVQVRWNPDEYERQWVVQRTLDAEPEVDETWGEIKTIKINDSFEITKDTPLSENLYFVGEDGKTPLKDGDKYIFPKVSEVEYYMRNKNDSEHSSGK